MSPSPRLVVWLLFSVAAMSACSHYAKPAPGQTTDEIRAPRPQTPAVSWGIPRFFEIGRDVQLEPQGPAVDTTGWPNTILRSQESPRSYLAGAAEDQSSVFIYSEPDSSQRLRRYALVVPEPKTFSTNGSVTAFWGRSPLFMNFAPGSARTFASFTSAMPNGSRQVIPLRARLQSGGINPQDLENVYELEQSRLSVIEHKGLIPGEPLSFLEFTVYDRDSTAEDTEPVPVEANLVEHTLSVGLIPLLRQNWLHRQSFESNGYRVVLVSDDAGESYFLAAPLELQPKWGFGQATTDLALGQLESPASGDAGEGAAAALSLEHATHGWLLSGVVRDAHEVSPLIERGERFRAQLRDARRALIDGATAKFAAQAARAFAAAHRSHRAPHALTRFANGDAVQPSNSALFSAGARYGQDVAGALRGLTSVERSSHDPELLQKIADLAEFSLGAGLPSGATVAGRFEQLAILAEHDETNSRSDVLIDNGAIAVAINHRRLVLASAETHSPAATWGAFSATINGRTASVDQENFEFSVDGASIPRTVTPEEKTLAVSRLFTADTGPIRIRETAQLRRGFPAVSVRYQLENRSEQPATVGDTRITVADFLEYGTGANESSQNHYGLGHVADGVRLPVGFWMEGMKAPLWGDGLAAGALDLTEQYRTLGARFVLVYGYDRAQIYFFTRPVDRLILYNGQDGEGLTRIEARYETPVVVQPHRIYDSPEVLSYTLRAPLYSVDGDTVPDQLQELAPLWTQLVSDDAQPGKQRPPSLETDSGHAALIYSWVLAADALASQSADSARAALVTRLRQNALRGSEFALNVVTELRNQSDWLPTYANGNDYGFHLAVFDWAYRETCDSRYRDAFLSLGDDLTRPITRGGLQISDPNSPGFGSYLSTQQALASGPTRLGDQGVRLWALRIAYERTGAPKYRRSAELFLDRWLRLDPAAHAFTGSVLVGKRYRDAEVEQERSPLGHYAVLVGLKAWADLLPRAQSLYAAGLAAAAGRHLVHQVGLTGPRRLVDPRAGVADFSDDAELGGAFLWATTFEPSVLRGRFATPCRRERRPLAAGVGTR